MFYKLSYFLIAFFIFSISFSASSQTFIDLKDNQSMCVTGKGEGQDAAENPFNDQDSYAIIKNVGGAPFEARVQSKGKIVKTVKVLKGKVVKLELLKGHELYFDSGGRAKASIKFERIE